MGRFFLFIAGVTAGLFAAPWLRQPQAKGAFHDVVKRGVKGTIYFGRQIRRWQEEIGEEIEDAAAEAAAETGRGDENGATAH